MQGLNGLFSEYEGLKDKHWGIGVHCSGVPTLGHKVAGANRTFETPLDTVFEVPLPARRAIQRCLKYTRGQSLVSPCLFPAERVWRGGRDDDDDDKSISLDGGDKKFALGLWCVRQLPHRRWMSTSMYILGKRAVVIKSRVWVLDA